MLAIYRLSHRISHNWCHTIALGHLLHLGYSKKNAFLKQNKFKVGLGFKRVDIFHKLHNMPVPVPTISSCIREIHTDYNLQTIKDYL